MGIKEEITQKAINEITEKLIGDMGVLHSGAAITIENNTEYELVRIPNKSFFFPAASSGNPVELMRKLGCFGGDFPPDERVEPGYVEGFDIYNTRALGYGIARVRGGCRWVTLWKFGGYELITGVQTQYLTNLGPETKSPRVLTGIGKSGAFSGMYRVRLNAYLAAWSRADECSNTNDGYTSYGTMAYKKDGHYHFNVNLTKI